MKSEDQELGAKIDEWNGSAPPLEWDGEPPEIPSSEISSRRFSIRTAPGAEIDPDIRRIAEFWLNVADGDPLWALLLVSKRMSQIADRESFGYRRGRSPVTPTGLLNDEELPWVVAQ